MNFCEHDQIVGVDTGTLHVMRRTRTAAVVAAMSLSIAACGGGTSTTDSTASGSSSADQDTIALDGVFQTISGSQIDLGSLEGQDTVLWFWAPW